MDGEPTDVIPGGIGRRKRNPWVLVGACATAGVLFGGLIAFKNGKSALAQHFMRARVVVQGATVGLMLASGGYLAIEAAQERADLANSRQD